MTTPQQHAQRFRIWQYASEREWNCTVKEIAEALGMTTDSVRAICQHRGWNNRLRSASVGHSEKSHNELSRSAYGVAMQTARDIAAGRIGVDP